MIKSTPLFACLPNANRFYENDSPNMHFLTLQWLFDPEFTVQVAKALKRYWDVVCGRL